MPEPRIPNPLLALLGTALEHALNRALALDPASAQRLRALEGRAIEASWTGTPIGLRVHVRDGRLAVGPRESTTPDLAIGSTLAGLAGLVFVRGDDAPPAGAVNVSGDAELARRVEQLVRRFDPDVEAAFARVLGDAAGPALARALKAGFDRARTSVGSLAQDGADYLRDETGDVVAREELDTFADDVDRLRDGVERIALRIARVTKAGSGL